MSRHLIKWHYLNAVGRHNRKIKQKDDELRFMMALIRPDLYKKLKEEEESTYIENVSIPVVVTEDGKQEFDIDYEKFKELAKQKKEIIQNMQNNLPEYEEFNPVSLEVME